jgi:ligand-binding sensor domain-containing protein
LKNLPVILLWVVCLFLGLESDLLGQDLQYKHFKTNDGLPSNTVYHVLQDKNGYMWFSTEYGVSRFDGQSFQNFDLSNGLSDIDVFTVKQDKRGRIWFLMSNGTLSYFLNGKIYNPKNERSLSDLVSHSFFNGMVEDPNGNIWFSTHSDGIFCLLKNGEVEHLKASIDLPNKFIVPSPFVDKNGEVWILGENGTINISKNPGLIVQPLPKGMFNCEIIYQSNNGRLFLGMLNKLRTASGPEHEFKKADSLIFINTRMVTHIQEDKNQNLWVSTLSGLYFFKNGEISSQSRKVFLQDKSITSFYFDKDDNLWISTLNDGVYLASNLDVIHYEVHRNTTGIPVASLYRSGSVTWFGDDIGNFGTIEKGELKWCNSSHSIVFGRGRIREFFSHEGEVGIVSEFGLIYLKNKRFYSLYPTGGKTVLHMKNGEIWLGTSNALLRFPGKKFKKVLDDVAPLFEKKEINIGLIMSKVKEDKEVFEPERMLANTRIFQMALDSSGIIWVATNTGLFSFENGKSFSWKTIDERLGKAFQNLVCLKNGMVALGSAGVGLFLLNGKEISQINQEKGLSSNYIKKLRTNGYDSIWVCTQKGLNLVHWRKGKPEPAIDVWTEKNGLISDNLGDAAFQGDTLILASDKGITFYPKFGREERFRFKESIIQLKSLKMGNLEFGPRKSFSFSAGHAPIQIFFRDFNFSNLGQVEYRYRIDIFQDWQTVSENQIQLTSLSPGDYKIEVQARIKGSNWSAPYLLTALEIKPSLFSRIFLVVSVLAAILFGFLFFFTRKILVPRWKSKINMREISLDSSFSMHHKLLKNANDDLAVLISGGGGEVPLKYLAKYQKINTLFMQKSEADALSIAEELYMTQCYLDLTLLTRPYLKIDFKKLQDVRVEMLMVPKFIFIQAAQTIFSLQKDRKKAMALGIQLARIGEVVQAYFQITEIGKAGFSELQKQEFFLNVDEMKEHLKAYNQLNKSNIEISVQEIDNANINGMAIQIWFPFVN